MFIFLIEEIGLVKLSNCFSVLVRKRLNGELNNRFFLSVKFGLFFLYIVNF